MVKNSTIFFFLSFIPFLSAIDISVQEKLPIKLVSITHEIQDLEKKLNFQNPYTLTKLFSKKPTMKEVMRWADINELRILHQLYLLQFIHTLKYPTPSGHSQKKYVIQELTNIFEQDISGDVTKIFMIFYHSVQQTLWTIFISHSGKLQKIREIDEQSENEIRHLTQVPTQLKKEAIQALDKTTDLILNADLRVKWKRWALLLTILAGGGAAWYHRKSLSNSISNSINEALQEGVKEAKGSAGEIGQQAAAGAVRTLVSATTRIFPPQYRIVDGELTREVGDRGSEAYPAGIPTGIAPQKYYIVKGTTEKLTPLAILKKEGREPQSLPSKYQPTDMFELVPARDAIIYYKLQKGKARTYLSPIDDGYNEGSKTLFLVKFDGACNRPLSFNKAYPEVSSAHYAYAKAIKKYLSQEDLSEDEEFVRAHKDFIEVLTTAVPHLEAGAWNNFSNHLLIGSIRKNIAKMHSEISSYDPLEEDEVKAAKKKLAQLYRLIPHRNRTLSEQAYVTSLDAYDAAQGTTEAIEKGHVKKAIVDGWNGLWTPEGREEWLRFISEG